MAQRSVSETAIALGAQQLQILLNATEELVAVLSAEGAVQFVNSAFHRVLGYQSEDVLGRTLDELVLPVDAEAVQRGLHHVQTRTGAAYSNRCRFRCRDSSWRWLQFRCQNRLDDVGFEAILFLAKDVTDVQRMESERQVNSEVVHALNETSNLDQLLTRIHEALKQILPAENCFVALHDP